MTAPASAPAKTLITREEYLLEAAFHIHAWIAKRSPVVSDTPLALRVSVGFPAGTRHGKSASSECWAVERVRDGVAAIFISPMLETSHDVLHNLTHELVHVIVGSAAGHRRGGLFDVVARDADLIGPLTATHAGPELTAFIDWLVGAILGKYEDIHSPLDMSLRVPEKTRMLKAFCRKCGFTARVARKWSKVISHKCPYPPDEAPPSMGGGSGMPEEEPDEIDLTPVKPPPSSDGDSEGEGDSSGEPSDSDESDDSGSGDPADSDGGDGDSSDEASASGDPKDKGESSPKDKYTCEACGGGVTEEETKCRHCGASFEEEAEGKATLAEGSFALPKFEFEVKGFTRDKHKADMCPFTHGCSFCEA